MLVPLPITWIQSSTHTALTWTKANSRHRLNSKYDYDDTNCIDGDDDDYDNENGNSHVLSTLFQDNTRYFTKPQLVTFALHIPYPSYPPPPTSPTSPSPPFQPFPPPLPLTPLCPFPSSRLSSSAHSQTYRWRFWQTDLQDNGGQHESQRGEPGVTAVHEEPLGRLAAVPSHDEGLGEGEPHVHSHHIHPHESGQKEIVHRPRHHRTSEEHLAPRGRHQQQKVGHEERADKRQKIAARDVSQGPERRVDEDSDSHRHQRYANPARADHGFREGECEGRVVRDHLLCVVLWIIHTEEDVIAFNNVLPGVVEEVGTQQLQGTVVKNVEFGVVQLDGGTV